MVTINTSELTEVTLQGGGVFDRLMRATKQHLEEEFNKGRIRGQEYATVYLGSLNAVMQNSIQFLLERDRAVAQAELLREQAETERKQQALLVQQTLNAQAEHVVLTKQALKLDKEMTHLGAQTALVNQQKVNLELEALNIPKQGRLLDAQVANAITENEVMQKQICKLEAEYDVLMETKLKVVAESRLLNQKIATEKAQTVGAGVDADSVIGRQKHLYQAQSDGFRRDAEQKAAKILVDAWNVDKTTDSGISRNAQNRLQDAAVGQAVAKLMQGIGA